MELECFKTIVINFNFSPNIQSSLYAGFHASVVF